MSLRFQRQERLQEEPWKPLAPTGQVVESEDPFTPKGEVFANNRYVVIQREYPGTEGVKMVWLSIRTQENDARHDWREFQRIKNELVGAEAEGVKLYPAESRLVDAANQFHLWCLIGLRFPFGFNERLVQEIAVPGTRQRAFTHDGAA